MPPRLPSLHPACRWANPQRCLSTSKPQHLSTTTHHRASIPPESPKFIDVPQSLQPSAINLRPIKGILPVPRKIFPFIPSPTDKDKTSPTYLLAVTPEPQPKGPRPPFTDPTVAAFIDWKARQSAARRRNLREGLVELKHRKERSDEIRNRRANRKIAERERLLAAPMREDERLTNPTVLQSQLPARLRQNGKPLPLADPNRESLFEQAVERTREFEEKRREDRKDQLHTLYMKANTFITSEEQLNAVVERVFEDKDQFKTLEDRGENIWHLGYPLTVAEMLEDSNRGNQAIDSGRKAAMIRERYERIAEVLTGGAM